VFRGYDNISQRVHDIPRRLVIKDPGMETQKRECAYEEAGAMFLFTRDYLKPITGPCVSKGFTHRNECYISYHSDLLYMMAGKMIVHGVRVNANDGIPRCVVQWVPCMELPMGNGRMFSFLDEVCKSKGLTLKIVGHVADDEDVVRLSLLHTLPTADKDVYIVRMEDVQYDCRSIFGARNDEGFLLMHKNDSLPITGNEPREMYSTFLDKADMKFMDVCRLKDCRSVCHHRSAACPTCMSTVCIPCLPKLRGSTRDLQVCPWCKSSEVSFIHKHRFKLCHLAESLVIYHLESNLFSSPTCCNPECTSAKPKKKYACPCWQGHKYCSKACQVAHWPHHKEKCWFCKNPSDQDVVRMINTMPELTKFLAMESFPKIRRSKAEDAVKMPRRARADA
jgi:hypothetical protein